MSHLIAPSMLASDFGNLKSEVLMVNNSEADWFHLDVMDGMFVPNISYGMPIIQAIKKYAKKPLDVHLMIEQPERYINDFAKVGADIITVHYEATVHLHRTLNQISNAGCKAGIVLNLTTPITLLEDIIDKCYVVLLMSINPGFGGQKFEEMTYNKKLNTLIEIDGGVTTNNAQKILNSGADVLVAGSSIFKSNNPTETISLLKRIN
jgi:ribulose-phosphate 3-epimerase